MATKEAILITIISIFIVIGGLLPFINSEFEGGAGDINTEGFEFDAGQDEISTTSIVFSIFKMFFWTFGDLPFWMDILFTIPRIMLAVISFQLIRGS